MRSATRKSSYLLLEIMCCLALMACCLWPLLGPCLRVYVAKQQMLTQLYQNQRDQEALVHIKEMLYCHQIPFTELKKGLKITLDPTCTAYLSPIRTTSKPSLQKIGLLIQAQIVFKTTSGTTHTSSHLIFVEGVTA